MKLILAALFALTLSSVGRDKTLDIYWIDSEGGGFKEFMAVKPELLEGAEGALS